MRPSWYHDAIKCSDPQRIRLTIQSLRTMALCVLHPERVALQLRSLIGANLAPEGVLAVEEDLPLPVAGLAGDGLVPVGVLHAAHHTFML